MQVVPNPSNFKELLQKPKAKPVILFNLTFLGTYLTSSFSGLGQVWQYTHLSTGNLRVSLGTSEFRLGNTKPSTGNLNVSPGNTKFRLGGTKLSTGNLSWSGYPKGRLGNANLASGNTNLSRGKPAGSAGTTKLNMTVGQK